MPVIKVQNQIKNMTAGQRLEVVFTDPGALNDIPTWCRINGHNVISVSETEYEHTMLIEVGQG